MIHSTEKVYKGQAHRSHDGGVSCEHVAHISGSSAAPGWRVASEILPFLVQEDSVSVSATAADR